MNKLSDRPPERQSTHLGLKIAATAIIWGFATGMLAICIPLSAMTDSGDRLGIAIVIGVSSSTITIWLSHGKPFQQADAAKSVQTLQQRVETLEATLAESDANLDQDIQLLEREQ